LIFFKVRPVGTLYTLISNFFAKRQKKRFKLLCEDDKVTCTIIDQIIRILGIFSKAFFKIKVDFNSTFFLLTPFNHNQVGFGLLSKDVGEYKT
jgi:hypothetical protein